MAWKDTLFSKKPKQGISRQAVLAHKEDIEEALKSGYTKMAIWQAMTADGVMPVSYSSFARALIKTGISTDKPVESKAKSFEFDPVKARNKKLI